MKIRLLMALLLLFGFSLFAQSKKSKKDTKTTKRERKTDRDKKKDTKEEKKKDVTMIEGGKENPNSTYVPQPEIIIWGRVQIEPFGDNPGMKVRNWHWDEMWIALTVMVNPEKPLEKGKWTKLKFAFVAPKRDGYVTLELKSQGYRVKNSKYDSVAWMFYDKVEVKGGSRIINGDFENKREPVWTFGEPQNRYEHGGISEKERGFSGRSCAQTYWHGSARQKMFLKKGVPVMVTLYAKPGSVIEY